MLNVEPSPRTGPFWDGAAAGRLLLPRCACGRWRHPDAPACGCGGREEWAQASGRGVVTAATVVRRANHPATRDAVPYTLLLVTLAEGPRLVCGQPGADPPPPGTPVAATFVPAGPDRTLVHFRPRQEPTP